ncbi:DUF4331 family protein [Nocardia camponoti]|uniref:DUF4331 domain-containing protein n=1 Tax=Nocardia camponoti TaxID=1616106 RepID=A0A917V6H0_9NOCA|nr:DUF4331 family protein [Nocardia camponoti]GGK44712.1 hypothetical protein GCM10011591_15360 [Nocardia camponoti]
MSHHLDTPLAAKNGQLYIDDFYAFPNDQGTVLIMDVNSNVTGVYQKPGFHHEARYEFKFHLGDADFESYTFRVVFAEADDAGAQAYQLFVVTGDAARDDSADGEVILDGRTNEIAAADGFRVWCGRVEDPFYADGDVLGRVNSAMAKGTAVDLTGWDPSNAKNGFAGTSVEAIVLQVPSGYGELVHGREVGIWCATKLATDAGGWRMINRGGHPMMWPIFWPKDTDFTNPANTRLPSQDWPQDGEHLAGHIAAVVKATGTSTDPESYGQIVARQLYPDVLTYVLGSVASYSFAIMNGRSLADNVEESMIALVTNMGINTGLKPSVTENQRTSEFPYLVPLKK